MFSHCLHCACGRQLTLSNFSVRALPFPCAEFEPDVAAETLPVILQQPGINRAALIRAAARRALIDEAAAPQAPRVGAHDVILTGLDEEGDSTDDEMPPLEPLEGAAQLGVVWLRGHGKDECDPITSAKLALQLRATQLGHASP